MATVLVVVISGSVIVVSNYIGCGLGLCQNTVVGMGLCQITVVGMGLCQTTLVGMGLCHWMGLWVLVCQITVAVVGDISLGGTGRQTNGIVVIVPPRKCGFVIRETSIPVAQYAHLGFLIVVHCRCVVVVYVVAKS